MPIWARNERTTKYDETKKGILESHLTFLSVNYLGKVFALHTKKRKNKREGWEVAITTAFADGGMGGEEALKVHKHEIFLNFF